MLIRTPDHRLRVFISSTLRELADERKVVRQAILQLRLAPIMFESGARPHPAQQLYQSYLAQSQIFIAIYWQSYGWVAPGSQISGIEDEYNLSANIPRLIYIKNPAPQREPAMTDFLDRIRNDNSSCYTYFSTAHELKELVQDDIALLLAEHFETLNRAAQQSSEPQFKPPTNLPVPRNPLVGRERELAKLRDLILRDDAAEITLTGPGGTGKSRLALQIGLDILDQFTDGVFVVSLEPIKDPNVVISTVAETLGIHETGGSRPINEILIDFLRDKHMLLVLDNFEQVVEAAPFLAELLEACPRIKLVVTSRTPLRLRAEREFNISPLPVPPARKYADLDTIFQYAAVELFIQRAQAVKPDFMVTSANAAVVSEICYRLDGLPLAIELAAARIRMLTPHELLARLGNRFTTLQSGARDLPERQRTLRGAIDWSYNLLGEQEKNLFRRLSIFVGGFTLEAAESICNANNDLDQNFEDILGSLIDDNLIFQTLDTEEQSRFGMLSTIHDYATERLQESGEAESIHIEHARYYQDFVKKVEPLIRSSERVRWHQVFMYEFGNIRSVLDWICRSGKCIEFGQQIVITLGTLWVTSSFISEGQYWCSELINSADESTPVAIRAALSGVAAWIAWAQGDHDFAQASGERALQLFDTIQDKKPGDNSAIAAVMANLGLLASASRDLATAKHFYQESLALFREVNNRWYEALVLSWLADVALFENERERAQILRNQSIQIARQQGDPWCLMPALMSSGQIAMAEGDLSTARAAFLESEDLLRSTSDLWSLSWALNDLAFIALMDRECNHAGLYFVEVLNLSKVLGNRRVMLISLVGAAALIAWQSRNSADNRDQDASSLSLAVRLCGATVVHIFMPGIFIWPDTKLLYEYGIAQVKSLVGSDEWESAYFEGLSMTINQAIELALNALFYNAYPRDRIPLPANDRSP